MICVANPHLSGMEKGQTNKQNDQTDGYMNKRPGIHVGEVLNGTVTLPPEDPFAEF